MNSTEQFLGWQVSDAVAAAERIKAFPGFARLPHAVTSEVDAILFVLARVAAPAAPTDEGAWKQLFWSVAQVLHCLPSTYVDGNAHVIEQAAKFASIAKSRPEAPAAAVEPSLPEGWKLVPLETTGNMDKAGMAALRNMLGNTVMQADAEACFRAMLAAAPAAPIPQKEGAGEVDAKDAGALESACAVNKKLGNVLLGRSYLLPDDLAALKRFEECASDFDSGGHDVPKPAMARLREIGVVQSIGFGRHQTTAFGDYVLERTAGEPVSLPLMTLVERNAAAAIAAQPKDTTDTRRDA